MKLAATSLLSTIAFATLSQSAPAPTPGGIKIPSGNPKLLQTCATAALGNDSSRVITPDNSFYTDARLGEKVQFDELPALITYAKTALEVSALVLCARLSGYHAVPRSGGHHFEGYSAMTGQLVIDVAHINYVNVSSDGKLATVGAGIRLGALYTELWEYDQKTFVGGICPTVGLGGLLSAGGFNMQMRALGFSIDHVLAAKVVLASGKIVTASPTKNQDLFWAIRGGGGGTFGIAVEYTLSILKMPRSAMVELNWPAKDRFAVAKRFLEWAPKAPKEFTSQVNVWGSTVQVLGWYYGKTKEEAQAMLAGSGLLEIGTPEVIVAGGCNSHNSRLFGYTVHDCIADDQINASGMNVIPEPYAQYLDYPQYKLDPVPKNPDIPTAWPWDRYRRITKTFMVTKNKMVDDTTLQGLVDRIAALPAESQAWGEWHAWNVSATGDSSFVWREEAYAVLEFQIHGSEDEAVQQSYYEWMEELETFLRPVVGGASYGGYMDKHISTNALQSYYGDNLCKLISIKKKYDSSNFFQNPSSIPPTAAAAGVQC
ncbi:hypothetical protein BDZ91DRAFT_654061 [Kalaharituber pfeilii]|nr:hypothetical protein BDZ91DRAFT_654061 [Kalaharituber pfeilii]